MPAVYELRFLPTGQLETLIGSRGIYYEFEDGTTIDLRSGPVWCRACEDFTDGESIASLDEIDQQLADLGNPRSELYRMTKGTMETRRTKGRFRRHWIEITKQRRHWRVGRRSLPRCLACGSTDLVLLPSGVEIPNPRGPGSVVLTVSGMCSTTFNNWFFTPEGERIPRETEPTYWALPD